MNELSKASATHARGEAAGGFVAHVPDEVDVKAFRQNLGLSQEDFAVRFGFSPAALRDFEQHRRRPEQARVSLLVIAYNPDVVNEALGAAA